MRLSKGANFLERFLHPASRILNSVGAVVHAAMILIVVADVALRYVKEVKIRWIPRKSLWSMF